MENGERGHSQQSNATLEKIAHAWGIPPICLIGTVDDGVATLLASAPRGAALDRLRWLLVQVERIYGITVDNWAQLAGMKPANLRVVLDGQMPLTAANIAIILTPAQKGPEALLPPATYTDLVTFCRDNAIPESTAIAVLRAWLDSR